MNTAHTAIKIISRKYMLTLGLHQNTLKTGAVPWMFPLFQQKNKAQQQNNMLIFLICQYLALLNLF